MTGWASGAPPPDAPYGPLLPPTRGFDNTVRAIGVAIVLLLAGGLVGVDHVVHTRARALRVEFDAAVRELSDFVAAERGAPFREPVQAFLLDDDEFAALLGDDEPDEESEPAEPPQPDDFGATMYSLRMADPQDDVDGDAASFADGVDGFYDEETKAFYARGSELTPYVRLVIVHELVHAWQDQHHGLANLREGVEDADAAAAVDALVEGDATRVEESWRETLSAADQDAIERAEVAGAPRGAPTRAERTLDALGGFPYFMGPRFVAALHERGGNAAVDAAFRDPPTTTEQVLHPERYLRKHRARAVRPPRAPVPPVDEGVLGELGLVLVLTRGDFEFEPVTGAVGWGGDAYVTWDDGTELCTAVALVMDTRSQRDRLVRTLRANASGPGEQVAAGGARNVRLRFCVPSRGR